MKIQFITFGSHDNYIDAGKRLLKQANELQIFTNTILYTPKELKIDIHFWNKHHEFITKNARGYGYWLWKPYIIKKTMEKMTNGDVLLYLDCGCELDYKKKDNLLRCIDIVKTDKIIGTLAQDCIEKHWNKMDLIDKLNMNNDIYLNTMQRQGGTNMFFICDETRSLINEWYKLSCDYHNIDDSPSIIKNLDCFKEHRHDQSIFSLLTKKYSIYSNHNLKDSIYCMRNRSGISQI